jgi:hypothetical protein
MAVFKNDNLVRHGVLERTGRSEWAAPNFVLPKKKKKQEKGRQSTLGRRFPSPQQIHQAPHLSNSPHQRHSQSTSRLQVLYKNRHQHAVDESSELCTIATPFGLYKYKRLPMGICQSPDVAQEIMEKVLQDIKDVECYIDDIGAFNNDWESHLKLIAVILERL